MNRSRSRRFRFPLILFALLVCSVAAFAMWSFSTTSAMTPLSDLYSLPAPTHAQSYGYAAITKPTYTASPTSTSTPLPTPTLIPTQTPEVLAVAEIIPDTPTPEYGASIIEQPFEQPFSAAYSGNKSILVDISDQHMYVYEGGYLAYSFVASTGMNNATRVGNFSVLNKIPKAYGATWNIWMPNWLGIYWAGSLQNGIHALPILPNGAQLWAGYLGTPISYGCVVLGAHEAQLLYNWADIGTPVNIQW